MKSFGKNLKEEMKLNKITQVEMAKLMNTTHACISHWCTGIREPSLEQFIQICHILHTTPNEMLDFAE